MILRIGSWLLMGAVTVYGLVRVTEQRVAAAENQIRANAALSEAWMVYSRYMDESRYRGVWPNRRCR